MKRAVFNQKGGVGKTSVSCNLAAAMAAKGKKVLLIDLDSQCNSSQYLLGPSFAEYQNSIADFFESTLKLKFFASSLRECLHQTNFDNLWIIPAAPELSELQNKLESRYKILKLRQALNELVDTCGFDEVLIDTPPALNFYSMSALIAADSVLIPFDCDVFSTNAILQVRDTVEEVSSDHQPDLFIEGVIVNNFQAKAKLPQVAINELLSRNFHVLKPYLSSSIFMKESHGKHSPLVYLQAKHKLSKEYFDLEKFLSNNSKLKKKIRKKRKFIENPSPSA